MTATSCASTYATHVTNGPVSMEADLQEVRLVGQGDGLGQGDLEGVGGDAAQDGHGVGAAEERVVLTRLCRDRVLVFVLEGGAWGGSEGQ